MSNEISGQHPRMRCKGPGGAARRSEAQKEFQLGSVLAGPAGYDLSSPLRVSNAVIFFHTAGSCDHRLRANESRQVSAPKNRRGLGNTSAALLGAVAGKAYQATDFGAADRGFPADIWVLRQQRSISCVFVERFPLQMERCTS